jgi:hypothetical protein
MTIPTTRKRSERSFMATMVAIAWSFIGLRRSRDFDVDAAGGMNPLYVILGGLLATALFIGVLIFFVKLAVP